MCNAPLPPYSCTSKSSLTNQFALSFPRKLSVWIRFVSTLTKDYEIRYSPIQKYIHCEADHSSLVKRNGMHRVLSSRLLCMSFWYVACVLEWLVLTGSRCCLHCCCSTSSCCCYDHHHSLQCHCHIIIIVVIVIIIVIVSINTRIKNTRSVGEAVKNALN